MPTREPPIDPVLVSLLNPFCDALSVDYIAKKCSTILLQIKFPENLLYLDHVPVNFKLETKCSTYKYRRILLQELLQLKNTQYLQQNDAMYILHNDKEALEPFCKELEDLIADRCSSIPNQILEEECRQQITKDASSVTFKTESEEFKGAVTRKSDGYASVVNLSTGNEVVVVLHQACPGYSITVKIGDILSVIRCETRAKPESYEYDVICCYYLDEKEVCSFLDGVLLKTHSENNEALSAHIELTRCDAIWSYILHNIKNYLSQSICQKIISKILELCGKVCSVEKHESEILNNIWRKFAGSAFLESLQEFIKDNEMMRQHSWLVQSFLRNFLKVCPEFAVKLCPMIQQLSSAVIQLGETTMPEFHCQLLGIIGSSVPGAKDLNWKQQPVIPAALEISGSIQMSTASLPKIKVKEKDGDDYIYASVEEYLSTYFTLIREECFHKLKSGIKYFINNGEFDPKDIMIYRVSLSGVECKFYKSSLPGMPFILKFQEQKSDKSEIDWESLNWLLYGDLLCISLDGSFKKPIWGLVASSNKELIKKGFVYVTLCSERNSMSDAEVVSELQRLTDAGMSAYMAESNTFYRAFGPSMNILQHKGNVPFKEYLVDVAQTQKVPNYIKTMKKPPEWQNIFGSSGSNEGGADYSVVDDFKEMRSKSVSVLDETQLDAVELALNSEVALIQGPPGTGKSFVGVALVKLLLSMNLPGPILVATYKNFALDHFLETCLEQIPECGDRLGLVRVGSGTEKLDSCKLVEISKKEDMPHVHYKYKEKLTAELKSLGRELGKAFDRLKRANVFDASMLIKEANDEHLLSLLKNSENVDSRRFKDLISLRHDRRDPNYEANIKELVQMVENALDNWLPSDEEIKECFGSCNTDLGIQLRSQELKGDVQEDSADVNTMMLVPSHENQERLCAEELQVENLEKIMPESTAGRIVSRPCKGERILPPVPSERRGPHFKSILNSTDMCALGIKERVYMIYALYQKHYDRISEEFISLVGYYTKRKRERQEIIDLKYIDVLRRSKVIGMTVTGAAIRADWLARINPCVMIVEEAAEILESQLVSVIPSSVQHLIMIGDHQQLRPQIHYDKLRRKHNMDVSLFERLIKGGLRYTQLKYQGRMRDEFADLLRELEIYDDLHTRHKLVEENNCLPCVTSSMFFITHTSKESTWKKTHSYMNEHEARQIVDVTKKLLNQGIEAAKITILCSYRGQVSKIQSVLNPEESEERLDIEVTTIDSFQGRENDVILLSLVRSPGRPFGPKPKIGYLSSKNRICVAISRARRGLYIFGDSELLRTRSRYWKAVITKMTKQKCYGRMFPWKSGGVVSPDGPSRGLPVAVSADPTSPPSQGQQSPKYSINFHGNVEGVSIGENAKSNMEKVGNLHQRSPVSPPLPAQAPQVRIPQETQYSAQPSPTSPILPAPIQEEDVTDGPRVEHIPSVKETVMESEDSRTTQPGEITSTLREQSLSKGEQPIMESKGSHAEQPGGVMDDSRGERVTSKGEQPIMESKGSHAAQPGGVMDDSRGERVTSKGEQPIMESKGSHAAQPGGVMDDSRDEILTSKGEQPIMESKGSHAAQPGGVMDDSRDEILTSKGEQPIMESKGSHVSQPGGVMDDLRDEILTSKGEQPIMESKGSHAAQPGGVMDYSRDESLTSKGEQPIMESKGCHAIRPIVGASASHVDQPILESKGSHETPSPEVTSCSRDQSGATNHGKQRQVTSSPRDETVHSDRPPVIESQAKQSHSEVTTFADDESVSSSSHATPPAEVTSSASRGENVSFASHAAPPAEVTSASRGENVSSAELPMQSEDSQEVPKIPFKQAVD